MGGSNSHHAHPGHDLRRGSCGSLEATCSLCGDRVKPGEVVYRCAVADCSAPFLLHDAIGNFSGHSLALTTRSDVAASVCCTVCTRTIKGFSHVYSCSQTRHLGCRGFHAHPRCGNLPRQASAPSHAHQLVLREPDAGGARRCLNLEHAAAGGQARAWSYQCPTCQDVEHCLPCVLGVGSDPKCCCVCGAGCGFTCAGPAGFAIGHFLHEIFRGCTGLSVKSAIGNDYINIMTKHEVDPNNIMLVTMEDLTKDQRVEFDKQKEVEETLYSKY
uniref:Uncharacterized protein n=1 Tax=Oryza punctata TaxID=4537 RepID=A0A0E0KG52_ORYPU